jgi:nucleoside-diphosphate-sugar epimerase
LQLTVLGGSGFIGSHLLRRLESIDWQFWAPDRSTDLSGRSLGHVIYAIGVTGDFRSRTIQTVDAHVCRLAALLSAGNFDSLTYLSSTRIYSHNASRAYEHDEIAAQPADPGDLYNLSKALAECLLLSSGRPVRILRLSNVFGPDLHSKNFLPSLIREALATRTVRLETSFESERDYVSVDDVTDVIIRTVSEGSQPVYNVAAGTNVTNGALAKALADLIDADIVLQTNAPTVRQPPISIDLLTHELGFRPRSLLEELPDLVAAYRKGSEQT